MSIFMIGLAALIAAIIFKVDPPSWMKQRMVFSVFSFFNTTHPSQQDIRGSRKANPLEAPGRRRRGQGALQGLAQRVRAMLP